MNYFFKNITRKEPAMSYRTVVDLPQSLIQQRNRLLMRNNKGKFWKPCPGTGEDYLCCGYQIITPLTGCGMYCSYCILQEYYDDNAQVVFENFGDLALEVEKGLAGNKGVIRFGTGEFCDSLFLERQLGLSAKIASLLQPYKNVIVEFKTKHPDMTPLKKILDPSKVVIGFSMNTEYCIALLEKNTASLQQRLDAARQCEEMGFRVAFHFDPMVWYADWKAEYRQVVDQIFSALHEPHHIAWWSCGGFRTIPTLKHRLRALHRHLPLFSGELILGNDNKYRYFRPIRAEFYSLMKEVVSSYYPECTLYLCMESRELWEESGMIERIPHGLVRYLDDRAAQLLGIQRGA